MTKIDFGSAENLVRIGMLLVFAAIVLLQGIRIGEAESVFIWMVMAILFLETFKLSAVSPANAAMAELILAVTMVVGGIKWLIMSMGRNFAAYHFYLMLFILGAAIICFSAYKRLYSPGKR